MFFRRRGGELALFRGEFLDDLEEFEGLCLRDQRKMMTKDLPKVSVYSGFLWLYVFSVSKYVFRRAWCLPWNI